MFLFTQLAAFSLTFSQGQNSGGKRKNSKKYVVYVKFYKEGFICLIL